MAVLIIIKESKMATGYLNFANHHTVAESTNILGTEFGEHIYNVQMAQDHDNGVILGLGDYVEFDYYAEAQAKGFKGQILMQNANGSYMVRTLEAADGDVLILATPKTYYEFETEAKAERQFYNAQGDIVRAYQLRYGDTFSLSKEGFTTEPTEAQVTGKSQVTVDAATGKLVIG